MKALFRFMCIMLVSTMNHAVVSAEETEPEQVSIRLSEGTTMNFRLIPAGSFLMGSADDEAGRHPDEGPQFEVTITRPYYLGETEVTQKQWMVFMDENP